MTMTRICTYCQGGKNMNRIEDENFIIEHESMTAKVEGLSGWRCSTCGEMEFDPESAQRYAATGDKLVLRRRIILRAGGGAAYD